MFEFTGCCVHLSWMEIVSGKIVEARSQRERSNAAMAQQMLMLAMEFERAAAGRLAGFAIRSGAEVNPGRAQHPGQKCHNPAPGRQRQQSDDIEIQPNLLKG